MYVDVLKASSSKLISLSVFLQIILEQEWHIPQILMGNHYGFIVIKYII